MDRKERLATISEEAYSVLVQFFQYDLSVPLNQRVLFLDEDEAHIREKVVFRGIPRSQVPGYLCMPTTGSPPYSCVLLAHGWGSTKEDWCRDDKDEGILASKLLSSGFAVFALDLEYHGERSYSNEFDQPLSIVSKHGGVNRYREFLVQSTIEFRRALDYLATRSDIGNDGLGVLGYSLGGIIAFILAAVDPRITVAVSCATSPITRFYMDRIGFDHNAAIRMVPVAPQTFAPAIKHTSFLMLNGKADPWGNLDEVQALYELVGSPSKELVLFEGGHGPLVDYIPKAVEWFSERLAQWGQEAA